MVNSKSLTVLKPWRLDNSGKALAKMWISTTKSVVYKRLYGGIFRKTLRLVCLETKLIKIRRDQEIKHVYTALDSNGYPTNLITQITKKCLPPPVPTPEELVGTFFKCVDPPLTRGFATLPYIKGLTEPLTRSLKKQDIQVINKPVKTLQQEFPAPKFRPEKVDQCNVVYKIPCTTCSWSYISETKRSFSTRKKEYARNVKMWQTMLGPKTTRLTLRMPQSLTSPTIATSRPLSPGIPQKLLTLIITPALSLINIAFFLTNNAFHTYHLYCSYFVFI